MNNIKSKIKTRAKLSEWQPMNNPPKITGVYEIETIERIKKYPEGIGVYWYSYWDGMFFNALSNHINTCDRDRKSDYIECTPGIKDTLMWRGKL